MTATANRSQTMNARISVIQPTWTYDFRQPTICNGLSLALWILIAVDTGVLCELETGLCDTRKGNSVLLPCLVQPANYAWQNGWFLRLQWSFSFVFSKETFSLVFWSPQSSGKDAALHREGSRDFFLLFWTFRVHWDALEFVHISRSNPALDWRCLLWG